MRKLFLLGLLAIAMQAQDISGSIAGAILDPSGAVVPHAKVTIRNTDRNQVARAITTGQDGNYSAPLLDVGTYSLRVEASGFRTEVKTGIKLNVHDELAINVSLHLGNASDEVTVVAEAEAVELGGAANTGTMDASDIRELSISTRNYEQLVALMPGVSTDDVDQIYIGNSLPSGLANAMPFSINGQRNSGNNWTVDGADNVDRGSNLTLLNYPSVDAIEQFKVSRSLYSADTGRAGGAQISVVTRSATKDYHGTAYEFVRNDAFAANNWINNANRVNLVNGNAKVPPLRWNNFGFTIGGPVPWLRRGHGKNRTFVFYSMEFRRIITYTTFQSIVPTVNERQGVFAVPVCTAFSGTTCSTRGTQIENINPVAAAYLKDIFSKLPAPTNGNTLFFPSRNLFDHRQEQLKIDQKINDRLSVWGRLTLDSIPTVEPGGIFTGSPVPNGATTQTNSPGRNFTVHMVNTFRKTLLNEGGYSLSYGAFLSTPIGLTAKANSPDIDVTLPYPSTLGVVPALTFNGGSSIVGVGPYVNYSHNHAFFDNLTWVRGPHTLKFGWSLNRYLKHENSPNGNNYGTLAFTNTGAPSGTPAYQQSWANFLLGNVSTFTQASVDLTADVHAWQTEAYAQDDFRVEPRLTLSYGVRYSYFGQPVDGNGLLTNFDPSSYDPGRAPRVDGLNGGVLVPGTGTPLSGMPGQLPVWTGVIVQNLNSPYGSKIANDRDLNFGPRTGLAWDPFGKGKLAIRAGYGLYYDSTLFGIYENSIFANPPFVYTLNISNTSSLSPGGGTVNVSRNPLALRGTPLPNLAPYSQQWSFDVQRQFFRSLLIDAGYHGSKSTHLFGIIDLNEAPPGLALANNLKIGSGTVFTSTDDPRINAVRPYQGFNAINAVEPWFNSNYHSLQVSVRKSFRSNGNISVAYTWAHNMTDSLSDRSNAPQNSYNFHASEYGPARLDRRQVLNFSYWYKLPGPRRGNRGLRMIAAGWEISGNTQYGTGLPYTVFTSGVDPGGLGILGSSAASPRPDQVCDPNQDAPHTFGAAAQTGMSWFNKACFANVPQGVVRPGNAGRGTVRGPGYGKWDLSLFKNISIRERWKLQLRGESFNVLNHPIPSGIVTSFTNSLFGRVTSFRDPRLVQLAAKLSF